MMGDTIVSTFEKIISELGRDEDVEIVSQSDKKSISILIKRIQYENKIFIIKNEKVFNTIKQKIKEHNLVRIFFIDELMICPMDNIMVPCHNIISEKDIEERLEYHKTYQLPRILFSDPIVRWNGWKCGSYIEVSRFDGTKYYRHLYCSDKSCTDPENIDDTSEES